MGGWGEAKGSGYIGTTGQIEEAHRELDSVDIEPGPLAARAIKAAGLLAYHKRLIKKVSVVDDSKPIEPDVTCTNPGCGICKQLYLGR